MQLLTIRSTKLKQTFTFEQRGAYLYCNGAQICKGGGYRGQTLFCSAIGSDRVVKMCRTWYTHMMLKGGRDE